jgi:hypothetical protein
MPSGLKMRRDTASLKKRPVAPNTTSPIRLKATFWYA